MSTVTGFGYDSHRLAPGRRLVIGGVTIDSELGLDGHSDADVLAHAIIDALLGAAGLGDIGQHFPDSDEAWRAADSLELLRESAALARAAGSEPVHVDSTVVLEAPKLGPHREEMERRLAAAIGLSPLHVNVKFTTGEAVGFVGRGEGAAAYAVVSAERQR